MSAWLWEDREPVDAPYMIHPTALVGDPPEHRDWLADQSQPTYPPIIEPGVRINSYVTVDAGWKKPTRVGAGSFLMTKSHVGHDAQVGAGCELAPGTVIGGSAIIGDHVKFGLNACVKPFITIGDGARIGMGAVVTKDVPAGQVWVGNPAHPLPPKGADHDQCGACGDPAAVDWYLDLSRPRNADTRELHARIGLCSDCYRRMMMFLEATPEREHLVGHS